MSLLTGHVVVTASLAELLAAPGGLEGWTLVAPAVAPTSAAVAAPATPGELVQAVAQGRLVRNVEFQHWVALLSRPGGLRGWTTVFNVSAPDTQSDID